MYVFPDSKPLICAKICAEREVCMKNTRAARIYARISAPYLYNQLITCIIMICGTSNFLRATTVW
jgi:hypothetical protein